MKALALCLLVACGGTRDHEEPALRAGAPAKAAGTATASEWRDWDALPPGALRRLGSQRLRTDSQSVAIRDDGTLALADSFGVLEVRPDSRYRVMFPGRCASDTAVRYAGGALYAACDRKMIAVRDGAATATELPCESNLELAPGAGYLACTDYDGDDLYVELVPWGRTPAWRFKIDKSQGADRVLVTDAGDVVVVESAKVSLVRAGAVVWTKPLAFEWSGLGADQKHVVGWDREHTAFVRLALADGVELSRVPVADYTVERGIAELPDGGSYFVIASSNAEGGGMFRARVDARTGKVMASWRGNDTEWGNAVSPSGAWAASVGVWQLMRIDLAHPAAPVDRTADGDNPEVIAFTPDGTGLAYASNDSPAGIVALFDVATGRQRAIVPAPKFARAIEPSPDGARFAISGEFGDFTIVDAHTGATRCTSDAIPGAALWWYGNRIVAHFPGDNGDDCDEITEGSITVADDRCAVIAHHEVYGMVEVLDAKPERTTAAFAKWKNECGAEYELVPYQAFAIDTRTGAKLRVPKLDGEQAKRAAAEEARQADDGDRMVVTSRDGRTRATLDERDDKGARVLVCTDAATGRELSRHVLPEELFAALALSPDAALAALADRGSVVLYPCRTKEAR